MGYFWFRCAGRVKSGLELFGLAAIDLDNHTAFHLEAVQTKVDRNTKDKLIDFYVKALKDSSGELKKISKHLVADAWFSRQPFVE